ncbi:MAG: hypothetical protein GXX96_19000 [Planctomycetaceae bacterium]|nr:hypothetical protein [Planctomycetaceae bacterium]
MFKRVQEFIGRIKEAHKNAEWSACHKIEEELIALHEAAFPTGASDSLFDSSRLSDNPFDLDLILAAKRIDADDFQGCLEALRIACKQREKWLQQPLKTYPIEPIVNYTGAGKAIESIVWSRGLAYRPKPDPAHIEAAALSVGKAIGLFVALRNDLLNEMAPPPAAARSRSGRPRDPNRSKRDSLIVKTLEEKPHLKGRKLLDHLKFEHPEYKFSEDIIRHAKREAKRRETEKKRNP